MSVRKSPWRRVVITLAVLVPVVAAVVHTSFQVSEYECEVCMAFDGRQVCRTVTGRTEEEGRRGAVDNACALLASGVTDTLRCQRTVPLEANCRQLVAEPSGRPTLGAF